jgi:hypothetical protein
VRGGAAGDVGDVARGRDNTSVQMERAASCDGGVRVVRLQVSRQRIVLNDVEAER